MKLCTLLPSLICFFAVHCSAAEPERIVTSGIKLEAHAGKGDPHPTKHRTYDVRFANTGKVNEAIEVWTYWFTGTNVTRTTLVEFPRFIPTATNGYAVELDVAPENGWAAVVRRKAGGVLAVVGSGQRFEMLARTPGAVPTEPSPRQK